MNKYLAWIVAAIAGLGVFITMTSVAWAAAPVSEGWGGPYPQCGVSTTSRFPTAQAACDMIASVCWNNGEPGQEHHLEGNTCKGSSNLGPNTPAPLTFYAAACPDGSAPDTTKPLAQQCPDPSGTCTAGLTREVLLSQGTRLPGGMSTDMAAPTNVQGCQVVHEELLGCFSTAAAPDAILCRWKVRNTGISLGSGTSGSQPVAEPVSPKPEATVPPFSPATGQGCPKGTVNLGTDSAGGSICGGSGSAPATPKPPTITTKPITTVTNPDGSVTSTKITERLNADGSKTTVTETTVTQPDGTSTTSKDTVTGKTPSGDTGKKDPTEEEEKSDFCKQHPELHICQNSQVSGSCDTLACTGDAITCAIARQTAEQNCRSKKLEDDTKASPQWTLGNQALDGTDPLAASFPQRPENGIAVALPQNFDTSGWLGNGSCWPDKTFPSNVLGGQTLTIPFSQVCQHMTGFRYAIMIIAFLMCFRMVSSTILRE